MGQSLQDQLLASGLANKKQARKARQDNVRQKQQKKKTKKQKQQAPAMTAEQAEVAAHADAAAAAKRQADKQRSEQDNAQRQAREQRAAAQQLLERHRVAREPAHEADPPYSYTMDGRIRRLPVSRRQRGQIADGLLAIVQNGEQTVLVERRIAERLQALIPERIALVTAQSQAPTDADDPYAGYEVPDDLMW